MPDTPETVLKPYPWCQNERIGHDASDIFCMECEAVGPRISFREPLNAEQRWNTRTPSSAPEVSELALDGMPAVHPYAIVRYKREGERWRVTSVEQTEDDPEAEL